MAEGWGRRGQVENPAYDLLNRQVPLLTYHTLICGISLSSRVLSFTIYKEPFLQPEIPVVVEGVTGQL